MFKNNFVVAIKCGGILREIDGSVMLPFNSEYSILLKNLDSRRAVAKVSIDGQDVLCGHSLVIHPNSEFELEGFLLPDLTVRNKFKFVQKTEDIVRHRGDRVDDGIVRVEFNFEKVPQTTLVWHWIYKPYYPWVEPVPIVIHNTYAGGSTTNRAFTCTTQQASCSSNLAADEGITVAGSPTKQTFSNVTVNQLEETSTVITIKLRGTTLSGKVAVEPLVTKSKTVCPTCGKKSRSSAKFCSNCGTCLI